MRIPCLFFTLVLTLKESPFIPHTLISTHSGLALCPAFDQQYCPGQECPRSKAFRAMK